MADRLRSSDYRFIAVCLALLAASTWFSVRYFYLAFPEASIDFRAGRGEAQAIAERFLSARGYAIGGYRTAASFNYDDNAKTFLEREAGLARANQMMGTQVRLWRWSYRWFRPQQKEEYRVDITPKGELAGFEHLIAESEPRPAISEDQAREAAERFLREELRRNPAELDFVEVSTVGRPARADRVFTWKERDFDFHGATIRREVTLLGNEVGGYREYLKIPEQWTRDYERLRSKNEVAQSIDSAVLLLLAVGMVVVIVLRVRRHDVRWRLAAWVGVAAMVLSLCASANQFPLQEFNYPTTDSYGSFAARQVLQGVLTALGAGGLLFVITAAAEPLYRESLPHRVSLGNLFRPRGLRTKSFLRGSILGLTLCGIFIAYQTAFYIVAYRFGAWSPADVPYTDLLNTRFPWLYVLFGGFLPAVSEEFMFRMFAIPFLRKLVRLAPAVVFAGFIWGFGHAGYPQQPFYIRGVEVGIGGVALGLIMLRWGILPTLIWHYSVDAMYTAMLLVRSQSLYLRLSGAASAGIMVLPVIFAVAAYWRRGGFEPEMGLTNAQEAPPAVEPQGGAAARTGEAAIEHRRLTTRVRVLAGVVFAAGILAVFIPLARFGESPNYRISMAQATAAADRFARAQRIAPEAFRRVTYPDTHWGGDDSLAGKYFLERSAVAKASSLFERNRPVRHWVTRYFRSLDREELLVSVHPESGQILGFAHTIPEERAGADLSPDAARETAVRFARARGVDVDALDLKESTSEKKPARRDYRLVWEARGGDARNLDEARYRVEIGLAGDQVSSWRSYWKLPEVYTRARTRQNAVSILVLALRLAVIAAALVYGIWLLIGSIRNGLAPWGRVVKLAAPAAVLAAAGPLLSLPLLLKDYNTAIPLPTFEALAYTSIAVSVVTAFVMLAAAVAFVLSFFPKSPAVFRPANRRRLGVDAAVAALAAAGLVLTLSQAEAWLMSRFPAQALYSIDVPTEVASAAPAVTAVAGAVRALLLSAAALALAAMVVKRARKRWLLAPLALIALTVNIPTAARSGGELLLSYGLAVLWGGGALLFCLVFARANYLAYALAIWILALRPAAVDLLATGNARLEGHGAVVIAVMVASVLAAAPIWSKRRASE